jgi:hypothetical protein
MLLNPASHFHRIFVSRDTSHCALHWLVNAADMMAHFGCRTYHASTAGKKKSINFPIQYTKFVPKTTSPDEASTPSVGCTLHHQVEPCLRGTEDGRGKGRNAPAMLCSIVRQYGGLTAPVDARYVGTHLMANWRMLASSPRAKTTTLWEPCTMSVVSRKPLAKGTGGFE